jgi:NADH dehydrogenase
MFMKYSSQEARSGMAISTKKPGAGEDLTAGVLCDARGERVSLETILMSNLHVVTGAFGYSGKYIARGLLARGCEVATLTNSPDRPNEFGGRIRVAPLAFADRAALVASLEGATVLYNTYWVRFDHRDFTHAAAVKNTQELFAAAKAAGVERIVHVSITNPSPESKLPYFAGKARLEAALRETGIPHSILRPAVLFGGEDILINNIAWSLRRMPVFGLFGGGNHGLRPIHVEDFAALAIAEGQAEGCRTVDAVGPESFTLRELVATLGQIIGKPRPMMSVPPALGLLAGRLVGLLKRDVFLTKEEITALMAGLLESKAPATGTIRLSEWAKQNKETLGREYASEMRRRRKRDVAYRDEATGRP